MQASSNVSNSCSAAAATTTTTTTTTMAVSSVYLTSAQHCRSQMQCLFHGFFDVVDPKKKLNIPV